MQPAIRKQIADAIKREHTGAQVSWSGEARIITLHVLMSDHSSEYILSIDNDYVHDARDIKTLTADILDGLRDYDYH